MDGKTLTTEKKYNATVIVPSLNPDEKLCGVVNGLIAAGFDDIIVIDDGSAPEYKANFPAESDKVTLLVHPVNRGKGAAMKTAFRHFLDRPYQTAGVVTVDGDGQHRPEDVCNCVSAMLEGEPALVLGCRNFDLPHVPFKSRNGNKITSAVFKILFGMTISDTQTGLRAIRTEHLPEMLSVSGDRYEYETNMLMALKPAGIPIKEVEIETVYINDNETSHFRAVRDSIRIYGLIIKFLLSSIAATVVDQVGHGLFLHFLFSGNELYSAGLARVISSIVNFAINKKAVFKGEGSTVKFLLRYYALAVPIILISAGAVELVSGLFGGSILAKVIIKIPVDLILFIASFRVQREWVFKKDKQGK